MYCVEEVESDLMYVNRFSYKRSMGRERTRVKRGNREACQERDPGVMVA